MLVEQNLKFMEMAGHYYRKKVLSKALATLWKNKEQTIRAKYLDNIAYCHLRTRIMKLYMGKLRYYVKIVLPTEQA